VLKYIRTIRNADKMIYNQDWIYCKALYNQNFSDNVIDNHHFFWEWAFESLKTWVCESLQDDSLHELLSSISYKEFSDKQWMFSEQHSFLHSQLHYHEFSADEKIHWQSKCKCQKFKYWIMSI